MPMVHYFSQPCWIFTLTDRKVEGGGRRGGSSGKCISPNMRSFRTFPLCTVENFNLLLFSLTLSPTLFSLSLSLMLRILKCDKELVPGWRSGQKTLEYAPHSLFLSLFPFYFLLSQMFFRLEGEQEQFNDFSLLQRILFFSDLEWLKISALFPIGM